MRRLAGLLTLVALAGGFARADANSTNSWVEVRSPHFVVVSNAPGNEARGVALRFEHVRAVFRKAFPGMRVYPDLPIVILAARDRASFQALEPPAWSRQGEVSRSGMMLRNPDKNFMLLLLNVPRENPYHVVYHEYAHLVLEDNFKNIPLWLNEGLAEFYGNSEIDGKTALLGLPSKQNLELLRARPLLPLETLFTVNQSSPYYNEENKGTIFYAESWALADYLMFASLPRGKGPIDDYLALVSRGSDPVGAAIRTFGNLDKLQAILQSYVTRSAFGYYKLKLSVPGGKDSYAVKELTTAQSEAVRGDFMARNGNVEGAKVLLLDALRREPQRASLNQSMGIVQLHEGHGPQAAVSFSKAAELCSGCILARFYNALALMQRDPGGAGHPGVETAFQDFIRFNPTFAPAYAALARFDATAGKNLSEARDLAAKASALDPHAIRYFFLEGEILLKMGNPAGALGAARQAVKEAQSPGEKSQAYVFLGTIQQRMSAATAGK